MSAHEHLWALSSNWEYVAMEPWVFSIAYECSWVLKSSHCAKAPCSWLPLGKSAHGHLLVLMNAHEQLSTLIIMGYRFCWVNWYKSEQKIGAKIIKIRPKNCPNGSNCGWKSPKIELKWCKLATIFERGQMDTKKMEPTAQGATTYSNNVWLIDRVGWCPSGITQLRPYIGHRGPQPHNLT